MLKNLLVMWIMFSISGPLLAAQAIFAGGSFWVMEALFAEREGIKQLDVGWIQLSSQQTRRQVVRVEYDAKLIGYGDLLTLYWAAVDAKDGQGQYCDRGAEFSPALYVQTPLQQRWAQQSRAQQALMFEGSKLEGFKLEGSTLDSSKLEGSKLDSSKLERKLAVRILPVGDFMPAQARHQHYYRQHPWLYANYRRRCGYPAGDKLTVPARASVPFATTVLSAQQ